MGPPWEVVKCYSVLELQQTNLGSAFKTEVSLAMNSHRPSLGHVLQACAQCQRSQGRAIGWDTDAL